MSFVARHGLWSAEQESAAAEMRRRIEADGLEVVRFSFPDQHGLLRGKTLIAAEALGAMKSGVSLTTTLLVKDTAHRTAISVFKPGAGIGMRELEGAADFIMVADPTTFRVLPWAEKTGWVLCDIYFPDGSPVPFATRRILRAALDEAASQGFDFVAGLEVEFHIFRLEDEKMGLHQSGQPGEPPDVSLLSHGYQYLTEQRADLIEPAVEILRRNVLALGLPLRSVEVEFGPSQCEFVFAPGVGIDPADAMVLFRSAAKQVARRHGYHVTFMCRPKIPNIFASGWHLHQSLRHTAGGVNAFMAQQSEAAGDAPLSPLGLNYLAGLIDHARAATLFSTPTLNGYKRYRSYSLAPDRAVWGCDNRGVMLRVLGGPGESATRIENRVGEPAANPYLYMASQIFAGLDGVARKLNPPPSADTPYEADAPLLPKSLREALDALAADSFFKAKMGAAFIDIYVAIKEFELARFQAEVTDWEQREYFEMF